MSECNCYVGDASRTTSMYLCPEHGKKPSPSPDVCCDEYPNCEHYVKYSTHYCPKEEGHDERCLVCEKLPSPSPVSRSQGDWRCPNCLKTSQRAFCPDCDSEPSQGSKEPATDDERLYTLIEITGYTDPDKDAVVDEFVISAWLMPEHFKALKEYFVEAVRVSHMEAVE